MSRPADKLLFFRPEGRWARLAPDSVVPYLRDFDFAKYECDPGHVFVGDVGPEDGVDLDDVEPKVFGKAPWADGEVATYLVWIDWHGTPVYFYDRWCRPKYILQMDLLAAAPILNIRAGADIPEIAAFLADRGD